MSGADARPWFAVVWPIALGVVAVLALFPACLFWFASCGFGGRSAPVFVREPSPDGRCELVRETANGFLDEYERLWITAAGEADRARWIEIAPEVDGTWHTEWWSPNHLVLTDYGAFAEQRRPYADRWFGAVRIETRPPATGDRVESPDGRFQVVTWTWADSRGTRTGARVDSTWQNAEFCSRPLVPEGPWSVAVEWLRADRVRVRVVPAAGGASPEVPAAVAGIAVEVVGQ